MNATNRTVSVLALVCALALTACADEHPPTVTGGIGTVTVANEEVSGIKA